MGRIKHDNSMQKGDVTYDASILSGIVEIAVSGVEGAHLLRTKNKGIKLTFDKRGIVADISIRVNITTNVTTIAFQIQQAIKHNVETMTNFKILKVDVHIADIVEDEAV